MVDEEKSEGRFARWSKRKLAAKEAADQVVEPPVPAAEVEALQRAEEEREAELRANREAAESVDLDSLTADSDFTVFMKEGVPELLKRKAMASLWRSNPVLANVDGLVDYGDDYGSPDLIMKTFKSAYQIGKGYFDKMAEEDIATAPSVPPSAEETATGEPVVETEDPDQENADDELPAPDEQDQLVAMDTPDEAQSLDDQEPGIAEPISPPRVSLRRRLELDRS